MHVRQCKSLHELVVGRHSLLEYLAYPEPHWHVPEGEAEYAGKLQRQVPLYRIYSGEEHSKQYALWYCTHLVQAAS